MRVLHFPAIVCCAFFSLLPPLLMGSQKSFVGKDRQLLFEALAQSRLRYHADYPAATAGNGLLTLGAYLIVETVFHRFQNNNPWYKLHQGDWWAGKGVGLARIRLPSGSRIDFYNLHALAERNDTANREVRYQQMAEMATCVNYTRTITNPAFVVGDFNTRMGQPDCNEQ